MKKIFNITLDTEFTIDFSTWGLSDAQQRGGYEAKRLVINHYLEQCGMDEFEVVGTGCDLSLSAGTCRDLSLIVGIVPSEMKIY